MPGNLLKEAQAIIGLFYFPSFVECTMSQAILFQAFCLVFSCFKTKKQIQYFSLYNVKEATFVTLFSCAQ